MGCGISSNKNVHVVTHIYKQCHHRKFPRIKITKAEKKKEYLTRINEHCWKKIINFLSYNDLKEIGKTNKSLNIISKHNEILIKFFKKTHLELLEVLLHYSKIIWMMLGK